MVISEGFVVVTSEPVVVRDVVVVTLGAVVVVSLFPDIVQETAIKQNSTAINKAMNFFMFYSLTFQNIRLCRRRQKHT